MTVQHRARLEAAARRAAAAVHNRAQMVQRMQDRGVEYATVIEVTPDLTVSLQPPNVLDSDVDKDPRGPLILIEGPPGTGQKAQSPYSAADGHFRLSQTLRWWDIQFAIQKEDVLTMLSLPDDTWLAFDIRSQREVNAGIRHNRPPLVYGDDVRELRDSDDWELKINGTAYSNGSDSGGNSHHLALDYSGLSVTFKTDHVVKRMEVRDKDGLLVGFVPVFLTLPGEE